MPTVLQCAVLRKVSFCFEEYILVTDTSSGYTRGFMFVFPDFVVLSLFSVDCAFCHCLVTSRATQTVSTFCGSVPMAGGLLQLVKIG